MSTHLDVILLIHLVYQLATMLLAGSFPPGMCNWEGVRPGAWAFFLGAKDGRLKVDASITSLSEGYAVVDTRRRLRMGLCFILP
jgi:hypothetical protein